MKKHAHVKDDESSVKTPFYKNKKVLGITITVVFLLIAVFTSTYLRTATVDLRVVERIAENNIAQNVQGQMAAQIRAQYPTLPEQSVTAEAEKRWIQYEKDNRDEIQAQAKIYAEQIKSQYQYETGNTEKYQQTYVLEMDPYLEWYQAVNLADHGTYCDPGSEVLEDGRCIDAKRLAPIGTTMGKNFHIWLEATMIKTVRLFNDNLDTLTIIFFLPVILGSLAVIPAFFIGKKLAGNIGGFVSAMIIATHPVLMNRTIGGFADTDGYNYLFPLLIIWLLFEALEAKHWWSRLSLAGAAGFFVGLYAYAWNGYFFTFFVLVVCFLAFLGYRIAVSLKRSHFHKRDVLKGLKELREPASVFGMFLLFSALSITILINFATVISAFTSPFTFSSNLQAATSSGELTGWPNILTTVAELNIPSLAGIVGNLGGILVVVLAGFGLFVSLINPRKLGWLEAGAAIAVMIYYYVLVKKGLALPSVTFLILFALPLVIAVLYMFIKDLDVDLRYSIFMMGWLLATLFATTKGIRFLLLGITPFAVGTGIAIGWLFIAISFAIAKEIKKPLIVQGVIGAIVLIIVFNPAAAYNPVVAGKAAAEGQFPGMNDYWWDAMRVIREQTPEDTIITSWWDFGHWFRNIGNRSVTFDGASQDPEPGHLVGRILVTPSEEEAVGLLRMLDCGQNTAFREIHKTLDTVQSRELVTELVMTDRAGAQKILSKTTIPAADHAAILEATHCTPPNAVFITSGDMVGKGGVWGHFGSWDFRKAVAYDIGKRYPQAEAVQMLTELNYTQAEAMSLYGTVRSFATEGEANAWIAPWPGYFTQELRSCTVSNANSTNSTVTCNIGLGLQQTNQGVVVLETVTFRPNNPQNATGSFALYANGAKAGPSSTGTFSKVVVADGSTKKITKFTDPNSVFQGIGLLVKKTGTDTNATYSVLLADPLQVDSFFTQLYFLDGAYSKYFTKLVDEGPQAGIIVWNVNWPKD